MLIFNKRLLVDTFININYYCNKFIESFIKYDNILKLNINEAMRLNSNFSLNLQNGMLQTNINKLLLKPINLEILKNECCLCYSQ